MIAKNNTSNAVRKRSSAELWNLDYGILQNWIEKGDAKPLPTDLKHYLEVLDMVRSMYTKYDSKQFIIRTLRSLYSDLTQKVANRIYHDAIQFFYMDNSVKKEAWKNFYAERLEELAIYAIERDELETARRCWENAAQTRGVNRDDPPVIPEEFLTRPIVIYVTDPELLGIPRADRNLLEKQIDNLPDLTIEQKNKIRQDAGIITKKALFDEDAEILS